MTTPMSLQPWSWQIFILIQLWWQFFQMLVYGDVVHTQTWYWPSKLTVSSHLHMSVRPVVVIRPSFLSDSFVKIWATCEIFWGKWFTAPPAKNFPYAYVFRNYVQQDTFWCRGRHTLLYESSRKLSLWKLKMICFWVRTRHVSFRTSKLEHVVLFWEV